MCHDRIYLRLAGHLCAPVRQPSAARKNYRVRALPATPDRVFSAPPDGALTPVALFRADLKLDFIAYRRYNLKIKLVGFTPRQRIEWPSLLLSPPPARVALSILSSIDWQRKSGSGPVTPTAGSQRVRVTVKCSVCISSEFHKDWLGQLSEFYVKITIIIDYIKIRTLKRKRVHYTLEKVCTSKNCFAESTLMPSISNYF